MSIDWENVEWYSRGRATTLTGPSVTISKGGRIVLNEAALALLPSQPEAFQVGVVLGTRGKATLVLQAAAKADSGSLALSAQGKKYSLNTRRFLSEKGLESHFGSDKDSKVELDADHGALVVQL